MKRRALSWFVVGLAPATGVVAFHGAAITSDVHLSMVFSAVGAVITVSCVLLFWELLSAFRGRGVVQIARWRRPFALVAASVAAPTLSSAPLPSPPPVVSELSTVVSPALAGAALAVMLERRKSAVIDRVSPRRLTDMELAILADLRHRARTSEALAPHASAELSQLVVEVDSRVTSLLEAVGDSMSGEEPIQIGSWSGLIRVLGYPEVVDVSGNRATFRKGKSLELLVWLCFNRDRMRRSAARTALWEMNVSDSTFATVISEMRRALRELMPSLASSDVARPTYTDEIDLTQAIITDFDLLVAAHGEFRAGGSPDVLADALRAVRDVPFAGANYGWADYDGTTTRIVIAVVDASVELAQWALAEGAIEMATVALRAGLRTMPDHPDLLEVQSLLRQHRVLGV